MSPLFAAGGQNVKCCCLFTVAMILHVAFLYFCARTKSSQCRDKIVPEMFFYFSFFLFFCSFNFISCIFMHFVTIRWMWLKFNLTKNSTCYFKKKIKTAAMGVYWRFVRSKFIFMLLLLHNLSTLFEEILYTHVERDYYCKYSDEVSRKVSQLRSFLKGYKMVHYKYAFVKIILYGLNSRPVIH